MNGRKIAANLYGGRTTHLLEAIKKRTRKTMATVSKGFLAELDAMDAQESGEYVGRWYPEEHSTIAGVVVSIEDVDTSSGPGKRVVLDDQGPHKLGSVSFFLNTVLRTQFAQKHIAPGAVIGIKYFGEVESKNGRSYKNFGVKVQEGTTTATAEEVESDPFEDE